jgi:hypothetical protein
MQNWSWTLTSWEYNPRVSILLTNLILQRQRSHIVALSRWKRRQITQSNSVNFQPNSNTELREPTCALQFYSLNPAEGLTASCYCCWRPFLQEFSVSLSEWIQVSTNVFNCCVSNPQRRSATALQTEHPFPRERVTCEVCSVWCNCQAPASLRPDCGETDDTGVGPTQCRAHKGVLAVLLVSAVRRDLAAWREG